MVWFRSINSQFGYSYVLGVRLGNQLVIRQSGVSYLSNRFDDRWSLSRLLIGFNLVLINVWFSFGQTHIGFESIFSGRERLQASNRQFNIKYCCKSVKFQSVNERFRFKLFSSKRRMIIIQIHIYRFRYYLIKRSCSYYFDDNISFITKSPLDRLPPNKTKSLLKGGPERPAWTGLWIVLSCIAWRLTPDILMETPHNTTPNNAHIWTRHSQNSPEP